MALETFSLMAGLLVLFLTYVTVKSRKQFKLLENQLQMAHQAKNKLQEELDAIHHKLSSAIKDPVTDLLGWQLFEDRINQSIKESSRYHLTMAVLYIDINDFKVISEALGHEAGDEILAEMAKRLEVCIRQVDTISRLTKDIFVALLTQLSKPEMAAIVAQRMLQSIAEPLQIHEHQLYVTASIGIAIYPADGQGAAALFRSADQALQAAKKRGKQVYQFYEEKINTNSQRDLILTLGLRRENVTEEFANDYQPIMNVEDNTVFCVDVLPYWQHPALGLVSSEELLNGAEKQNKLNKMTEWLLQTAGSQFLSWRKSGFAPRYLGIPLFIKQLENSQFIYRVSQILKELQFNPEWLIFEVKEDHVQLSYEVIERAMNMLKYLHIKLAVVNFGSSGFSLRHLKTLGFDFLKLDRAFVEDIENNKQAAALIKSLVFMAKNLSVELIVQGVETEKQVEILKELGCTIMQGKGLGETLPEKELATIR